MKVSKVLLASLALGSWLAWGSEARAQDQLLLYECEAQDGVNCRAEIPKQQASLSSTMVVPTQACPTVFGVRAGVKIDHPWVGDLVVTLTNDKGTATLLDRHGTDSTAFGCAGDNVDAIFYSRAAEPECGLLSPAIRGSVKPVEPLSVLAGIKGDANEVTYTLRITDSGAQSPSFRGAAGDSDNGRLLGWSVLLQCAPSIPAQFGSWVIGLTLLVLCAGPWVIVLRRRRAFVD